jgi:16S rRNA (uracil1498-N3)-methyltransferase
MELFFIDVIDNGLILLDQEESTHCVRVLRHRAGDEISVIDGRGTLYRCILENADPKGASARVVSSEPGFGGHPYHLTMAVCPTKNIDRFEWFVEKATEIGVDVIAPVIGERSERKVLKTERLERIVRSAAKQSLKGAVPTIASPSSVRNFILSAPDASLKMICYCFDGNKHTISELLPPVGTSGSRDSGRPWPLEREGPAASAVGGMSEAKSRESKVPIGGNDICILIGPEGDFSPEEAELALSRGWKPVTLGKSRLRTETAALVAVAQVYSAF